MTNPRATSRRPGRHLIAGGLALLLSACAVAEERPSVLHPVSIERDVASLALHGSGDQLSEAEADRLDAFFRHFRARGHGLLTISVPGGGIDPAAAEARGEQVLEHAMDSGVRREDIEVRLEDVGNEADPVLMTYDTFFATLPECGDWSKNSSWTPRNTVHTDFGCSQQRNFAQALSDPVDTLRHRAEGPRDATRSSLVIQQYRAGEATLSERDIVERAKIVDVQQ